MDDEALLQKQGELLYGTKDDEDRIHRNSTSSTLAEVLARLVLWSSTSSQRCGSEVGRSRIRVLPSDASDYVLRVLSKSNLNRKEKKCERVTSIGS